MISRTRLRTRVMSCALLIQPAAFAASPAHAQSLTINATGTIGSSCTIAATTPFGTPNLTANGSVGAQATINCNTGFKVNARSSNGAMKTATTAPANFTDAQPYSLLLTVPLEGASPVSVTCASSTLVTGQSSCALSPANSGGLSSGGKASINRLASLSLSWSTPSLPTRLVAGSYSDTITLTVAAVP